MEELDANGDGEIDFQEFMAMMSNQDPTGTQPGPGTFAEVTEHVCVVISGKFMGIYHANGMTMLCYIQYSTYHIHFLFVVKTVSLVVVLLVSLLVFSCSCHCSIASTVYIVWVIYPLPPILKQPLCYRNLETSN